MMPVEDQIKLLSNGDFRMLARTISLIENEVGDYENVLKNLPGSSAKIIGITGAPGSGKSSLVDALTDEITMAKQISDLISL